MFVGNFALKQLSLTLRLADKIVSGFHEGLCYLPPYSRAAEYIVSWLKLGKHEMEVRLILILLFNSLFYLRVSLQSHFQVSGSAWPIEPLWTEIIIACYKRKSEREPEERRKYGCVMIQYN